MATSNLIIFLHGIGASGAQLQPLAASWRARLPDTSFATPDAPFRTAYRGHQWFGVDGMQFDPARIQEARAAFDGSIKTVWAGKDSMTISRGSRLSGSPKARSSPSMR